MKKTFGRERIGTSEKRRYKKGVDRPTGKHENTNYGETLNIVYILTCDTEGEKLYNNT